MNILNDLEPKPVFRYFEEICSIPHGSGNTKEISDYLVRFAETHRLRHLQDAAGNVIIWKAGTDGYTSAPPVMLQGHMDMVCEKTADCGIDFEKDGLELRLDQGIVTANGTTLGGDDGIAVAYALAILASDTIPHPPLEAVFTVDEEIGMLGAAALDASPLKSRIMLNIDSEEEGYLLVSCAGGSTAVCHLPAVRISAGGELNSEFPGIYITLHVGGAVGGHSGTEIDKGRANTNQLLGRALERLGRVTDLRIISANGGSKDNAIPVYSEALLICLPDSNAADISSALSETIDQLNLELKKEYETTDPDIHISFQTCAADAAPAALPLTASSTRALITALCCLPGGIQKMSFDIDGLVQTSLNMGILETDENEIRMSFSVRSSLESEKQELLNRMETLMRALGGSLTHSGDYPAWEYQKESPLRDLMIEVFEKQYGRTPVVQAIHAGVECGLFAGKLPGLDCVSFGPDLKEIHTPRESMDVKSVQRTWDYLLEVLRLLTADS